MNKFRLILLLTASFLASCQMEYSPYAVDLHGVDINGTAENLDVLQENSSTEFQSFTFVVMADTHHYYSQLEDAVSHINRDDSIEMVLIAGDLTNRGLKQEFMWAQERLDKLNVPYLTVIGNHDALANGVELYKKIFGKLNYSFVYHNVKFIVHNNNNWEFHSSNVPDLDWLEQELLDANQYTHVIVMSHVPVDDNARFDQQIQDRYHALLFSYDVSLYLNGHQHGYANRFNLAGTGVHHITIGSVSKSSYIKVSVASDEVGVELVNY